MSTADPFALDIRITAPVSPAQQKDPQTVPIVTRVAGCNTRQCTKSLCNCTFNPIGCGSFVPGVC